MMSMSGGRRKNASNPLQHKELEVRMFIQVGVFQA